ncbi:MAG: ATP-binding protein [Actinomycetota bacterium]|nr:ATP-binding protein [Actinomycetota bacterium]
MPTQESDKLIDFVTNLAGDRFLKVEKEIGSGYFVLNTSEAERRQAKHDIRSVEDVVIEMVRNSRDAGASIILIASTKDSAGIRQLTVIDDGEGVPPDYHETIFEPRVTSKIDNIIEDHFGVHGRGMALYSIRSNVDKAGLVKSAPGRGAVFAVTINTRRLRERKDQSTFPNIKIAGDKVRVLAGPHNIWRHLVEISLAAPQLDIFFGTNSEILATLASRANQALPDSAPAVWAGTAKLIDPEALGQNAASELGLKVSTRNCQRIIAGDIQPLHSIKCQLSRLAKTAAPVKTGRKVSGGPIAQEDLESFAQAISESFRNLGEKYFIKIDGKPRIACSKTAIKIDLPVDCEDSW